MDNPIEMILEFFILFLLIGGGVLSYFFYNAVQEIKVLRNALGKLSDSFAELDEQAKMIVKTDLELNKTQEELDKRLNGLDALQKTSRLISTTLDENEVFRRLNQFPLNEHADDKILVYTHDDNNQLNPRN